MKIWLEALGWAFSLLGVVMYWGVLAESSLRIEGLPLLFWGLLGHAGLLALVRKQWFWARRNPGTFFGRCMGATSVAEVEPSRSKWVYLPVLLIPLLFYALSPGPPSNHRTVEGNLAKSGGSPTVRVFHLPEGDDPLTTNDELNDQPLGYYGSSTLLVYNHDAGNYYTLDADIVDGSLERLYFPKGGWIDFYSCTLDEGLTGECTDEEGRDWEIEGEG